MSDYFGRRYKIDIGNGSKVIDSGEEDHPLQIEFLIDTTFGSAFSQMELTIYNLNKNSIGQISQEKSITVHLGYEDSFGVAFIGKISNIITPTVGTERKVTLYCWSGVSESRSEVCELSFAEGANFSDIVDAAARGLFNKDPKYIGFSSDFKEKMGKAVAGYNALQPHATILDNLARELKFQWVVENENCVLFERGSHNQGAAKLISVESGLVGGVSLTYLGADITTKLDPSINIGDRVKIKSNSSTVNFSAIYQVSLPKEKTTIGDGNYVVKTLRRVGSFYSDNSWNSELVCWREGEKGLNNE